MIITFYAILIILFLIIFIIFLNHKLKKEIDKEVKKNRQKDKMIFQQSKMAGMGEMLSNISHQWKQPLATTNTIISILKETNQRDILTKENLNLKLDEIERNIQHMSQTIEDFSTYFNPNKIKSEFMLNDAIDKALPIFNHMIDKFDITIDKDVEKNISIVGYKDEYIQVIVSLIINAIQAFDKNQSNKKINISSHRLDESVVLEIGDNAGGIETEIIDRIFEPYFTTKYKKKGTGLGLYISKMIIESSMGGELLVSNIEDENSQKGVKFTINV
jgi:C4-dicarboxylate-specific signal transduction histidine kinase